jgi:hypothetical protein
MEQRTKAETSQKDDPYYEEEDWGAEEEAAWLAWSAARRIEEQQAEEEQQAQEEEQHAEEEAVPKVKNEPGSRAPITPTWEEPPQVEAPQEACFGQRRLPLAPPPPVGGASVAKQAPASHGFGLPMDPHSKQAPASHLVAPKPIALPEQPEPAFDPSTSVASSAASLPQMTIPWRKALEEKKAKALQEEKAQAAVPAAGPRLTFEELRPDCQVPDPSNGLVLCRNPKCGVQMADKGAWAFCKPCMNILWKNKAVWNKIEGSEEQKEAVPVMFEELRDVGTGYDVETELVWCRWPDCGVFLKPRNNGVMAFCKPHKNAIPVVMRRRLEIQQQQFSSG